MHLRIILPFVLMALLCSCNHDDPNRDLLPGKQTQLLGKWEGLEVSETSEGTVVWVLGRGFEFLPEGRLTLHTYWNRNWKAAGSTAKDYTQVAGRYSITGRKLSITVDGEDATGEFPPHKEMLEIKFSDAENSTFLMKVSEFKFE